MNLRLTLNITGRILFLEGILMLVPLMVSVAYNEDTWVVFAYSGLAALALAGILTLVGLKAKGELYAREGFFIVGLSWILLPLVGALPFFLSGVTPNFMDAVFESISGFTTTGATILLDIETMPRGVLFWRSFTHFIGGMGVLILFLALLPALGHRSLHLLRAESTGPAPGKLVPKIGSSTKILYTIYLVLTALEIVALLCTGLNVFDAVVHAMATAGTGGFSAYSTSLAASAFNPAAQTIVTIFMFLFGINFGMFYFVFKRKLGLVGKSTELRVYLGVVIVAALLIAFSIAGRYADFGDALHHSFFQVTSIITTTGFATDDYAQWPGFAQMILVLLMVSGASGGSTSGGIKILRISILAKAVSRSLRQIIHPRAVSNIRVDGRVMPEETVTGVLQFMAAWFFVLMAASLAVSLDNFSFETSFTAALSALNNIGPGLGDVGPLGNFSAFSDISKGVLSFCMLLGRLEILPILVLLTPSAWRKQ